MRNYSRYAIYYAPEAGSALARFGASWLGWDAANSQIVARPDIADLPVPVSKLTKTPRKYGFHGTLKPPFELYGEPRLKDLETAVQQIALHQSPFMIPAITLRRVGGFLAITPKDHNPELAALAAQCVQELDRFRAPPTHAELARRCAAKLTVPQKRNLARWGYPYVLDEFRFHLTLTSHLEAEVGDAVLIYLQAALAGILKQPLVVREICLFGENEGEEFHILKRFALAG